MLFWYLLYVVRYNEQDLKAQVRFGVRLTEDIRVFSKETLYIRIVWYNDLNF